MTSSDAATMVTKSARFICSWLLEKISSYINTTDLTMFVKDILLGLKVMNWKVSKGIKDTSLLMGIKVNSKGKKVGGGEDKKKGEGRKKEKGKKEGKKEKVLLAFLMFTLISEKKQRWRGVVTTMTVWSIYQAIYNVEGATTQPTVL